MLGQLKRNDTNFTLNYTILNEDGTVVDLTGAYVEFTMGKKNTLITKAQATIVNATAGQVKYDFTATDTLRDGNFLAEFTVMFDNDLRKTYPNNSYIAIAIQPNLDTGQSVEIIDGIAAKTGQFESKLDSILARTGNSNPEVVDARDNYITLAARLNDQTNTARFQVSITDKKFGAKGDKIASDSAAFQAALNLAKLNVFAAGIEIRVPAGTYRVTSRLIIYRNTTVTFDEGATLFRDHSSGYFINGESTDNFVGYGGNGNIVIQGGVFEGNIANRNTTYNAIGLARGRNIIFRDIEIRDVRGAHAIDMNACKDVIIERCRFLGYDPSYVTQGDNLSNMREAIQISNHTIEGFTGFGAYDGQECENVTVRDCYFGASANLPAYPTGVGNHGHYTGKWNKKIYIYNNLFDGMTFGGVRPYKFMDIKIHHNHFNACSYGVRFSNYDGLGTSGTYPESGKNIEITDNSFVGSLVRDIYIAAWEKGGIVARCSNIKILDNTSEGSLATQTIWLSFCDDVQIRGNIIEGAYRAVYLQYCSDVHIFGNNVEGCANEFVYINEPDVPYQNIGYSKFIFICHNEVQATDKCGIFIGCAVDEFEILFNYVRNATLETVGTRSAIIASTGAKNGRIMGNKIRGINHKYGVEVTATCSNVQTFNNDVTGAVTKPCFNGSTGGFEGYYMHSPNGNRYKVTISDVGALTATIG